MHTSHGASTSGTLVCPSALSSGGYAYAIVDSAGDVEEANESNNVTRYIWPNPVTGITFAPEAGTFANAVSLSDDQMSGALPIGFDFTFLGNTYSEFQISSNGFITFNTASTQSGCCAGLNIPLDDSVNDIIAFAWMDLLPSAGGTISYETRGNAPNRRLIVNFDSVPCYSTYCATPVTAQVTLYEGTNIAEIHTTNLDSQSKEVTQGFENSDGTEAYYVDGRVAVIFGLTNDAIRFDPN